MILYVNGDSHSAGAEAVNRHCFAQDDTLFQPGGRRPHPDNLKVSYGQLLANQLGWDFHCQAESASSNDRIIRTTREYLKTTRPDLIIIGWATWEREERLFDGIYYQMSGGMQDVDSTWPLAMVEYYRHWVLTAGPNAKALHWHNTLIEFHEELQNQNIPHLFFNTYTAFNHDFITPTDWNQSYLDPYDHDSTYFFWLKNQGYQTVNQNSFHFGPDAHRAWANHLTNTLKDSILIK